MVNKVEDPSKDWVAFPKVAPFEPQAKYNGVFTVDTKPTTGLSPSNASHYSSRRPPTPHATSTSRKSALRSPREEDRNEISSPRSSSGSFHTRATSDGLTHHTKPLLPSAPDRTYSSTSSSSASEKYEQQTSVRPGSKSSISSQQRGRSRESPKPRVTSQVARSLSRGRSANSSSVDEMAKALSCGGNSATPSSKKPSSSSGRERGRSHSRSRPPNTRNNKQRGSSNSNSRRSRSRSRSASLTRVTGPTPLISSRGHSPRPSSRKPPSTMRTRQEMMLQRRTGCSRSLGRSRHSYTISDDGSYASRGRKDGKVGRDIITHGTSSSTEEEQKTKTSKGGLLEKLFGDQVGKIPKSLSSGNFTYEVRPRILLAATVYHNTASNLWIATINTNQRGVARDPVKANRYLKAYTFATEREARESAIANAPPKFIPFSESPVCFMCKGKFAVFRRASHCRNCGVCVCPNCTVSWPAKCVPETYNLKQEAHVKVCLACNSLSSSFKAALLEGDYEDAVGLYGTGNINLRNPFPSSSKKEETMYPIHCAVEGGNLDLLRWLLEDRHCPFKTVPSNRSHRSPHEKGLPILTSRGRSLLGIAVEFVKLDIMQYLVATRGVPINECSDLKTALRALEAALVALPLPQKSSLAPIRDVPDYAHWDNASFDENSEPSSLGVDDFVGSDEEQIAVARRQSSYSAKDSQIDTRSCVLCLDRKVDVCAAACGHQSCCRECSMTMTSCLICGRHSDFVPLHRP